MVNGAPHSSRHASLGPDRWSAVAQAQEERGGPSRAARGLAAVLARRNRNTASSSTAWPNAAVGQPDPRVGAAGNGVRARAVHARITMRRVEPALPRTVLSPPPAVARTGVPKGVEPHRRPGGRQMHEHADLSAPPVRRIGRPGLEHRPPRTGGRSGSQCSMPPTDRPGAPSEGGV